jgi:hypothetical protein
MPLSYAERLSEHGTLCRGLGQEPPRKGPLPWWMRQPIGPRAGRVLGRSAGQGPLRHFLAQLDELRSCDVLGMDQVGRLLVELAAGEEYLGPLIAEMPSESPGGKWLIKPGRGPRLVLFHRPGG